MIYLFSVEDRFTIEGRGVVLVPGIPQQLNLSGFRKNAEIQLRKPDLSVINTIIRDFEFPRYHPEVAPEKRYLPILLPKSFHKFDIPIGTEVFLLDDPEPSE